MRVTESALFSYPGKANSALRSWHALTQAKKFFRQRVCRSGGNMKTICMFIALLISVGLVAVQSADPLPEIQNMLALVNADTLQAYVQHLQNYQTRYALADNHTEVANWIRARFESYGFTNVWMQEYPRLTTTQYNVIADIPGSQYPDRYIITGAHYDSQSEYNNNFIFAPGADDNASGTAGLLEMARVMKATGYQPRCTIRFIAFSAEEGAGWGSDFYCEYAISENQNIRLMVNQDMIAANNPPSNEFLVVPYTGFEDDCIEAMAISQQYVSFTPVMGDPNEGSDSFVFAQNGFDSVFFHERHFNNNYHTCNDVIDILDFDYTAQIVRAATATTAVYANKPLPPTNLTVSEPGTGNSLTAQWEASSDPMMLQYAVYCGTSPDSLDFCLFTQNCHCLVTGLSEGLNYYVAVASVNETGNNSEYIYAQGSPLAAPRQPQGLADYPSTASITLTWAPNIELDLESYGIYRSLGQTGASNLIATIPASLCSYTDSDVVVTEDYYYYRVCAIDSQGLQSPPSEAVSSRVASLNQGICVIDESKNFGGSSPFQPTDQAVDEFYAELLEDYELVHQIDLEDYSGPLRVAEIGVYSSICWHGNENSDLTFPHGIRDALRQYINVGGKVMFSLYFPSKAFELNAGYPEDFLPGSFMYDVLGISGVDYRSGARFKYANPSSELYPALQVDSLKTVATWNGHIFGVEAFEPVNPQESMYQYGSDYSEDSTQGILNGSCVGLRHTYGAGQAVCLSFPLYNMQFSGADALVDYIFGTLFNEPSAAPANPVPTVTGLSLSPGFPNPFTFNTSFRIENADPLQMIDVRIYNLKGQLIQTVYHGYPQRSSQLVWNGRDARGKPVGSGIYIIKASASGRSAVSKILKVN